MRTMSAKPDTPPASYRNRRRPPPAAATVALVITVRDSGSSRRGQALVVHRDHAELRWPPSITAIFRAIPGAARDL
jgi:hypothetical protein